MSTRQFYNTPMSSLIPGVSGGGSGSGSGGGGGDGSGGGGGSGSGGDTTFYDLTPLTEQQREAFNDLFALTPPLNFVETHMWFGKKPVGFFGTGHYKLFLQNGTFTMQPGTTYRVRVVGGGGGGGRDKKLNTIWGGAGGGYSEKIIACKAEEVVNITVGAGGAAGKGTETANGQAGGTSSFGTHLSATGGGGGSTGTVLGGKGIGGDINYTGGNCTGGWGGASAASDFGNGISKTTGGGGNGLQSSATWYGSGGLFGNSDSSNGGGLWGNCTGGGGGGMFVDNGGACYTDDGNGVYTLGLVQPQKYKTSNSAELQQNSFLQKDGRQGLLNTNYEFTTRPMFGMGGGSIGSSATLNGIIRAGFGGGGTSITIPGWGGGWGGGPSAWSDVLPPSNNLNSRPYSAFFSSFGAGSPVSERSGGNGAGVITGGEVRLGGIYEEYPTQGGLGGGGGGVSGYNGDSQSRNGNPGGYGAVLVEW